MMAGGGVAVVVTEVLRLLGVEHPAGPPNAAEPVGPVSRLTGGPRESGGPREPG